MITEEFIDKKQDFINQLNINYFEDNNGGNHYWNKVLHEQSFRSLMEFYNTYAKDNHHPVISEWEISKEQPVLHLVHNTYTLGQHIKSEIESPFPIFQTENPELLADALHQEFHAGGRNVRLEIDDDDNTTTIERLEWKAVEAETLTVFTPTEEHKTFWELFISIVCPRMLYDLSDDEQSVIATLPRMWLDELRGLAVEIENVRRGLASGKVYGFIEETTPIVNGTEILLAPNATHTKSVYLPTECVSPSIEEWKRDGAVVFPCEVDKWEIQNL